MISRSTAALDKTNRLLRAAAERAARRICATGPHKVNDPTVSPDGDDPADDVAGADRRVGRGLRIAAKLERHAADGCRRRDHTMGEQSHAMTAQQDVSAHDLLGADGNDGNRFTVPDRRVHAVALSPEAHGRSVCEAVDDYRMEQSRIAHGRRWPSLQQGDYRTTMVAFCESALPPQAFRARTRTT